MTRWPRAVVHLNVAHFAVAVERVVDSRLRDRPVIVAPEGAVRAVVFDMSAEAFAAGVRRGQPLARAQQLCRDATLLPPRFERYERASNALWERTRRYAPAVEVADEGGHLFLDLTGTARLFGPPPDVAWRIRRELRRELGLEPIWSVAPNKLLAKVATRLVKPSGEYVVEPGDEARLLRPLPLHLLPGVERDDLRLLSELNLERVEQVTPLSAAQLQVAVGSSGLLLHDLVRGVDASPVIPGRQRSAAAEVRDHAFLDSDTGDPALVQGAVYGLVEAAGRALRRRRLAARRVGLSLTYADGVRVIRSASASWGTANDLRLFGLAQRALERAWVRRVRLRHLRLCCDRLTSPPAQLSLFASAGEGAARDARDDDLVAALDSIRGRFGDEAIRVGRTLGLGDANRAA
jgi:DNA polymerase IV